MNRFIHIHVLAFGLSLTPACGGGGDGGGSGQSIQALCQKVCTLVMGLDCPNDESTACVSECRQAEQFPDSCQAQAKAALECATKRPASDWACDEEGEAALKDGICDDEGDALLECVTGNNEDGTCPFENDDECDDPTGTDLCPAGTDLADCG